MNERQPARRKRHHIFHDELKKLRKLEDTVRATRQQANALKKQIQSRNIYIDDRIPHAIRKKIKRAFDRVVPNYSNGATARLEPAMLKNCTKDTKNVWIRLWVAIEGKSTEERKRNATIISLILESNVRRTLGTTYDYGGHRDSFTWDEYPREFYHSGRIEYPTKAICPNFYTEGSK